MTRQKWTLNSAFVTPVYPSPSAVAESVGGESAVPQGCRFLAHYRTDVWVTEVWASPRGRGDLRKLFWVARKHYPSPAEKTPVVVEQRLASPNAIRTAIAGQRLNALPYYVQDAIRTQMKGGVTFPEGFWENEPEPEALDITEDVPANDPLAFSDFVPQQVGGVLDDAKKLINGDRQKDYGTPQESFNRIAAFWTEYLRGRKLDVSAENGGGITGTDVANMMILLKVSRAANGFHRDSYVDIAGYAGLTEVL